MTLRRATATIACIIATYGASGAELPDEIAAKGETVVFQAHAEGAQIYECKAAQSGGQLSWQFREPVAALFQEGKTVGLHYAGPKWEIEDSLITAKVSASVPSPSGKDIPWLKLEVITEADAGPLQDVTAVQRINIVGSLPAARVRTVHCTRDPNTQERPSEPPVNTDLTKIPSHRGFYATFLGGDPPRGQCAVGRFLSG